MAAVDHEVDFVPHAGGGVDRTQFIETLRLTPDERLIQGAQGTRWLKTVLSARRVS